MVWLGRIGVGLGIVVVLAAAFVGLCAFSYWNGMRIDASKGIVEAGYVSNDSGQFEIYVRPFSGPDRRWQVSTKGGTHPRWSRDGKEVFYRVGQKMMAVAVSGTTELAFSTPRELFERRYSFATQTIANYDVSAEGHPIRDGER